MSNIPYPNVITLKPAINSLIPIGIRIKVQQHNSANPQIPTARGTRINSHIRAFSMAPVILNPIQNKIDRIARHMINVNILHLSSSFLRTDPEAPGVIIALKMNFVHPDRIGFHLKGSRLNIVFFKDIFSVSALYLQI